MKKYITIVALVAFLATNAFAQEKTVPCTKAPEAIRLLQEAGFKPLFLTTPDPDKSERVEFYFNPDKKLFLSVSWDWKHMQKDFDNAIVCLNGTVGVLSIDKNTIRNILGQST